MFFSGISIKKALKKPCLAVFDKKNKKNSKKK